MAAAMAAAAMAVGGTVEAKVAVERAAAAKEAEKAAVTAAAERVAGTAVRRLRRQRSSGPHGLPWLRHRRSSQCTRLERRRGAPSRQSARTPPTPTRAPHRDRSRCSCSPEAQDGCIGGRRTGCTGLEPRTTSRCASIRPCPLRSCRTRRVLDRHPIRGSRNGSTMLVAAQQAAAQVAVVLRKSCQAESCRTQGARRVDTFLLASLHAQAADHAVVWPPLALWPARRASRAASAVLAGRAEAPS